MRDGNQPNRGKRRSRDDGRSGYGSESVRPYLRAQLRAKELLQGAQLGSEPDGKPGNRREPR
ncbi:hypothetical protein [Ramlibacter albus]|uniref:Uncharacterized protein n=1 Tax=Ramlibacter albus TaxID=2079448 RepID=A0A923MB97_9BURK|nr:hypothetical protein [Ramlibacter albus]MBC5767223.1 hypothetical protein [Ramlibacter albus]